MAHICFVFMPPPSNDVDSGDVTPPGDVSDDDDDELPSDVGEPSIMELAPCRPPPRCICELCIEWAMEKKPGVFMAGCKPPDDVSNWLCWFSKLMSGLTSCVSIGIRESIFIELDSIESER